MKRKGLRIIFLVLLISISCQEKPTDHAVFKYFPEASLFEDGFVSKYYYHYYPDNPDQRAATEIGYTKYTKLNDTLYKTDNYNAGFDWQSERYYVVTENTILLDRGRGVDRGSITDTFDLDLVSKTISVWEGEMEKPYQILYQFNSESYTYSEMQKTAFDSVMLEKPARVFNTEWDYVKQESDSLVSDGATSSYYVQGMGYIGARNKGPDYLQEIELVEQMSVKEFEKRANHGEHRTAYIDPSNTMSDDSDFKICNHEREIADYYWSNPDARYSEGKRAMLDTIYAHVDESKLVGPNGKLVFRFVVNCEGQAGRFVAEGFDLDYQRTDFNQETVDHLFGILQKLEKWEPVLFGDELQDAYFYITFNIENGEIVDILP